MDEGERIIRAERAKLLELKDQRAKQLRGMEASPQPLTPTPSSSILTPRLHNLGPKTSTILAPYSLQSARVEGPAGQAAAGHGGQPLAPDPFTLKR